MLATAEGPLKSQSAECLAMFAWRKVLIELCYIIFCYSVKFDPCFG